MMRSVSINLSSPAHEMAQEEILKKVPFVSRDIVNPRFENGGAALVFETSPDSTADHTARVEAIVQSVQRGLRGLQRRIKFRSKAADAPIFLGSPTADGVFEMANGQVALAGIPLLLFRYFDRVFEEMGLKLGAQRLIAPTLIPSTVLAKCNYFRSFPHNVTFAAHLREDAGRIDEFRQRHQDRDSLDDRSLFDMETPEACLTPALCYHVYHLNQGRGLGPGVKVYGLCGKCFRYESTSMRGLQRLWDFTMREVVFLGSADEVLEKREQGIELMAYFLDELGLAAEIRTASDPFFIAPDAASKTYFQLSSGTKFEVALMLPNGERVAASSFNYHADVFGLAFDVTVGDGVPMHSACIGYGMERWICAFLSQYGDDPDSWPGPVRQAPEFAAL